MEFITDSLYKSLIDDDNNYMEINDSSKETMQ